MDNGDYNRLVTIEVHVLQSSLLQIYSAHKGSNVSEEELDIVVKQLILNTLNSKAVPTTKTTTETTTEITPEVTTATTEALPIDQDPGASRRKRSLKRFEREVVVKKNVKIKRKVELDEIEIVGVDPVKQGSKEFITFYLKNTVTDYSVDEIVQILSSKPFTEEFKKELGAEMTDVYAGIPRVKNHHLEIICIVLVLIVVLVVLIGLLVLCLKKKGKLMRPYSTRLERGDTCNNTYVSNTIQDGDIIPVDNLR